MMTQKGDPRIKMSSSSAGVLNIATLYTVIHAVMMAGCVTVIHI